MVDIDLGDLARLDRDVARAAAAVDRWRRGLARDPESAAEVDPLAGLRHVAVRPTWTALAPGPAPAVDAPLREGLRRWVHALLQARVGHADEVALARARTEATGRFEGDPPRRVSWRQAWREVLSARSAREARLGLRAAAEIGPVLARAMRARAERQLEVARRLGLDHPWQAVTPVARGPLRDAAARVLDGTEDLWRAVRREVAEPDAAAVLHAAAARDASEGWPARLAPRWLEETFPAARGLPLDLPELPAAIGAASYARALQAFGFAVREATARAAGPFAVTHEPGSAAAHRIGFVFGALAADREFHARALGLPRRAAERQARTLAWTALLEARTLAVRLLAGAAEGGGGASLHEELAARLFGAEADPGLRGAWPSPRDDEPARFVALLQAPAARDGLRASFDVDWFRNPRAWDQLRAQGATPAWDPVEDVSLAAAVPGLARAFEESLA
jgi:hypothetical protein